MNSENRYYIHGLIPLAGIPFHRQTPEARNPSLSHLRPVPLGGLVAQEGGLSEQNLTHQSDSFRLR
jgi:hypothetical protein